MATTQSSAGRQPAGQQTAGQQPATARSAAMSGPLTRPAADRVVAGVCAGLARYLNLPVGWVRAGICVLAICGGAGVLFYAWLWTFVPAEDEAVTTAGDPVRGARQQTRPPVRGPVDPDGTDGTSAPDGVRAPLAARFASRTVGWQVVLGVVLLAVAAVLILQAAGAELRWGVFGPGAVALLGVALAWLQVDTLHGAGRAHRAGRITQLVLGLALVLAGVLALAAGFVGTDELWLGLFVALAILGGVLVVAVPWVLKAWREKSAQRAALAVQTERAEIAAHLHDSVLQSLALIQRHADDPSQVTRLTRMQERELRQYLYQDPSRPAGALAERLEDLAAGIEADHGISQGRRIEVVSVGTAEGSWLEPIVQAAREAMLNGIRHAGDVQVYAEASPEAAEVFVKDRGAGFEMDAVPADRMGVRESVIGRMERAGGSARITTSAHGTEVHLRLPALQPGGASTPAEETA